MQTALSKQAEQDTDDRQLMAAITLGDDAAFATLVRRHTARFYRLAYRFVANQQEAEDIVQDAFIRLWEKPANWNPDAGSAFTTWFHRVVINLSLDRQKKKKPLPLIDEAQLVDMRDTQEEIIIARQKQQRIEAELAALPERQRVALNLCFYEGLSNQEAADIMKLKLKALQSLLMRAKTTLKQNLIGKE